MITCYNGISQELIQKSAEKDLLRFKERIPIPTVDEIAKVPCHQYARTEQMIMDISRHIKDRDIPWQRKMQDAFTDVVREESRNVNLNRLTNEAVYVVCWIMRYQQKKPVIFLHIPKKRAEWLYLSFLDRLGTDVTLWNPSKAPCEIPDSIKQTELEKKMDLSDFPKPESQTIAYQAEQELDTILYQDSGLYRDYQCKKAEIIPMRTTFEEIRILWDQEMKYRVGFEVKNNVAKLPVIFAKISGAMPGAPFTSDITKADLHCDAKTTLAVKYYKNKKLDRKGLLSDPAYPYGYLKKDIQSRILDCAEAMLSQKVIKGTFENGMEYNVLGSILGMDKKILQILSAFDYTKRNPKAVVTYPDEKMIVQEEAILLAFFHFYGFDVLFLVPTGYETVEKYYPEGLLQEHIVGEYQFGSPSPASSKGLFKKIFSFI